MRRGAVSRAHRTPAPAAKAEKGRGRPDVEERAIERAKRQASRKDVAEQMEE